MRSQLLKKSRSSIINEPYTTSTRYLFLVYLLFFPLSLDDVGPGSLSKAVVRNPDHGHVGHPGKGPEEVLQLCGRNLHAKEVAKE